MNRKQFLKFFGYNTAPLLYCKKCRWFVSALHPKLCSGELIEL